MRLRTVHNANDLGGLKFPALEISRIRRVVWLFQQRMLKFISPIQDSGNNNALPKPRAWLEKLSFGSAGLNRLALSAQLLYIKKSAYYYRRFDNFRIQEKEE